MVFSVGANRLRAPLDSSCGVDDKVRDGHQAIDPKLFLVSADRVCDRERNLFDFLL
jgi:hypothetical protein